MGKDEGKPKEVLAGAAKVRTGELIVSPVRLQVATSVAGPLP